MRTPRSRISNWLLCARVSVLQMMRFFVVELVFSTKCFSGHDPSGSTTAFSGACHLLSKRRTIIFCLHLDLSSEDVNDPDPVRSISLERVLSSGHGSLWPISSGDSLGAARPGPTPLTQSPTMAPFSLWILPFQQTILRLYGKVRRSLLGPTARSFYKQGSSML